MAQSIGYLQALLGTERWFSKALGIVERLGGLATESEILLAIGRGNTALGKTPNPNVELDRDGTNDLYVEPQTKRGRVDSPSAQVYEKPDAKSKKLASLPKGTEVYIMGRAGNEWLAIDHGKRTAFVSLLDVAA